MSHTLSLLLFLFAHVAGPKPLAGYSEAVVERFSLEKHCELAPIQSNTVQQRFVSRLRARKLVAVIDRATADGDELAKTPPPDGVKRMTLSATIVEFVPGNRAARTIGIGAGAMKLRIRITIKDAVTGAEILSCERLARYSGRFTADGGTNEAGFSAVVTEVVDGLIAEIEKNR